MNSLRILITDTSFLISEKGTTLSQKTFTSNEECFTLLTAETKKIKAKSVECFLSGSHLISKTIIVKHDDQNLFIADQSLIDGLVENARHAFIEEHKDKKLAIVSTKTLNITMNGYVVTQLNKTKINSLQVSVFFTALIEDTKKQLVNAIGSRKTLEIGHFGQSLVHKAYKTAKTEDFIVCSPYERSTDISVRKNGGFFETATITLGTHHVLDHISKGLNISVEEAAQQLGLYNEEKLDVDAKTKIEAALSSFKISLDDELRKALVTLSEGVSLPKSVYIFVATEFKKAFDDAFKSDSYHALCLCESGFEVVDMSSILMS